MLLLCGFVQLVRFPTVLQEHDRLLFDLAQTVAHMRIMISTQHVVDISDPVVIGVAAQVRTQSKPPLGK